MHLPIQLPIPKEPLVFALKRVKAKPWKSGYRGIRINPLRQLGRDQYPENRENYVDLIDQLKPTGLPTLKLQKRVDMTAKLKQFDYSPGGLFPVNEIKARVN